MPRVEHGEYTIDRAARPQRIRHPLHSLIEFAERHGPVARGHGPSIAAVGDGTAEPAVDRPVRRRVGLPSTEGGDPRFVGVGGQHQFRHRRGRLGQDLVQRTVGDAGIDRAQIGVSDLGTDDHVELGLGPVEGEVHGEVDPACGRGRTRRVDGGRVEVEVIPCRSDLDPDLHERLRRQTSRGTPDRLETAVRTTVGLQAGAPGIGEQLADRALGAHGDGNGHRIHGRPDPHGRDVGPFVDGKSDDHRGRTADAVRSERRGRDQNHRRGHRVSCRRSAEGLLEVLAGSQLHRDRTMVGPRRVACRPGQPGRDIRQLTRPPRSVLLGHRSSDRPGRRDLSGRQFSGVGRGEIIEEASSSPTIEHDVVVGEAEQPAATRERLQGEAGQWSSSEVIRLLGDRFESRPGRLLIDRLLGDRQRRPFGRRGDDFASTGGDVMGRSQGRMAATHRLDRFLKASGVGVARQRPAEGHVRRAPVEAEVLGRHQAALRRRRTIGGDSDRLGFGSVRAGPSPQRSHPADRRVEQQVGRLQIDPPPVAELRGDLDRREGIATERDEVGVRPVCLHPHSCPGRQDIGLAVGEGPSIALVGAAVVRDGEEVGQTVALDLARRTHGYRFDHVHDPRGPCITQALRHDSLHCGHRQLVAFRHDSRSDLFPQGLVRRREDGDIADRGKRPDGLLHRGRCDRLPAPVDHLLGPTDEHEVPFGVHTADVACPEPAVNERTGVDVGTTDIARHDVVAPDDDIARFAGGHLMAGLVDHPDHGVVGRPDGATMQIRWQVGRDLMGCLGHAVGLDDADRVSLLEGFRHRCRQGRGRRTQEPEFPHPVDRFLGEAHDLAMDGRHRGEVRGTELGGDRGGADRIEAPPEKDLATCGQRRQESGDQSVDVGQWHDDE